MIYRPKKDRDAARHLRRGALRDRAEVGRRDPQHAPTSCSPRARPQGREEEGGADEASRRGGVDRGGRVRAPDAGRALVADRGAAPARRSIWGWGYEDQQPRRAELRGRGGRRSAAHLGFGGDDVEQPVPLERRRAAARRGSTPPGLARRTSARPTTARPRLARLRQGLPRRRARLPRRASTTRPTWSRCPRDEAEVEAVLDWCAERGRGGDPLRRRHERRRRRRGRASATATPAR